MKLNWLCAEKATAVSLGCFGLMLADGGLIAGGAIAGAGLLDLWNKARRADGVNSRALLAEARAGLLADYARWAEGRDLAEADLVAADLAMERHLPDCVPPVAELARTTFHDEEFPAHAARLVVDRLAGKNHIFSDSHPERAPLAREFALLVMNSALTRAKEQPPFLQRLTQEVVLLLPQHLVQVANAVKEADQGSQERDREILAGNARTEAMLKHLIASQQQSAATQGVSAAKLRMLALRIVAKVEDENEAGRALSAAIDELLRLRDDARRVSNFGDEVDEATRRIFARVEANDLDDAGRKGAEEYRRLGEMMQGLQAAQASLAETNLSVARMAFDASSMAHWMLERRRLAEGISALSLDQLRHEQELCYNCASRSGERLMMDVAIDLAQRSIAEAKTEIDRATCKNDLGVALAAQGTRIGGTAGLELLARAVSVYEAVLAVHKREFMPDSWAGTQDNLGIVLQIQGERTSGESGLSHLARAVLAHEAALEVHTHADLPDVWARTYNNLGTALSRQGHRTSEAAGLALLARSVTAYEAALHGYRLAARADAMAIALNNMGNALVMQGERSAWAVGLNLFARAVTALQIALTGLNRWFMPVDWAMIQNSLGLALSRQAERTGGAAGLALLDQAVTAYEAALEVRTKTNMPADWAMTQQNIALAEEFRGDMSYGAAQSSYWCRAEAALQQSLSVYDPQGMGLYHERATAALARVRSKIAGDSQYEG